MTSFNHPCCVYHPWDGGWWWEVLVILVTFIILAWEKMMMRSFSHPCCVYHPSHGGWWWEVSVILVTFVIVRMRNVTRMIHCCHHQLFFCPENLKMMMRIVSHPCHFCHPSKNRQQQFIFVTFSTHKPAYLKEEKYPKKVGTFMSVVKAPTYNCLS